MRIALVSDSYLPRRGGIEAQLSALAARLRAEGHDVTVLTAAAGEAQPDVRRLAVARLPGTAVAVSPRLGAAVRRALAAEAWDVVHVHASVVSPLAWAAVRAARRLGLPAVLSFHSALRASARLLAAADALGGWTRGALVLTAPSAYVAAQLRAARPAARLALLPNATDVAWWRAAHAGRVAGPPGVLRLATAMRLAPKKRPGDLVRALVAAPAARLTVAGDGSARAALERAARRAGVAERLTLLGWCDRARLRALYAASDAFVLPCAHESFGLAALEARAAGLPVVGRAATGLADFVAHGVDGWLADRPSALADAVARLADDARWRGALTDGSAARSPAVFDWAPVLARHLELYASAGR